VVAAVVVLAVIARGGGSSGGGAGGPRFDVGQPAAGATAPPIHLPKVGGGTWDLGVDGKDKTVLLYFQEGVGCQPCWDQITKIEADFAPFRRLGVDELVTITVDPLDTLSQKIGDEGITTTALSDSDLSLGPAYNANQYGMMGTSTYGHSFILVGPDGHIRWRADYGGSPDYTMFVPVSALLDDLRAGLDTPAAP
jgi:peroxiredoxin Q/BCP